MSKPKNKASQQDAYYEHGNSMRGLFRSLIIAHGRATKGRVHVRDAINVKRTMSIVAMCLLPAMLFGMYNIGLQAQLALSAKVVAADVWQLAIFNTLTGGLTTDTNGVGLFFYGMSFYLPIYIAALTATLFWEVVFARARGQEVNEGFFVTALLFTLIVPVGTPLWLVAMGITFGVVVAKELFGGMGYNFLNPALAALAFIYFAYPSEVRLVDQLVAVDGYSGATTLMQVAKGKIDFANYGWSDAFRDPAWRDAFLGLTPGSIGETSTLALLLGGIALLLTRLADWRIVAGVFIGMVVTAVMFNTIGSAKNEMFAMPWTWHLVSGGFAIGMMFMATDPITTSYTRNGKYAFGFLVGLMTVLIRVVNPKMPEGIMLAILFANLWAPIFDYVVAQANIKRRLKRNGN